MNTNTAGYPQLSEAEMTSMPAHTGYVQHGQLPMAQQQTIIVTAPSFGTHNATVTCSNCGNNVQTKTEKHPSVVAWISSVALCCLGCCVAFLIYYLFFTKPRSPEWWKEHGIPEIDPSTTISSFDLFLGKKTIVDKDAFVYNKMGPFCGVVESSSPIILLKDLDVMKKILIKDFDHFVDRRNAFPIVDKNSVMNKFVASVEGEEWKNLRQSLSPSFTTGKIRRMMEHFNSVGLEWIEMLRSKAKESGSTKIDVLSTMNQYIIEVIAQSVFAMKTGTIQNPNTIFAQKAARLGSMGRLTDIIKMSLSPRYPKVFEMLGIEVMDQEALSFFVKILRQSLEARLKGEVPKRNDFQQLLIDARKGELKPVGNDELDTFEKEAEIKSYKLSSMDKSKILTDDVIVAQSVLFFLAGFTGVASFITMATYCLAMHQDVQEKLREEVEPAVKEDGSISYDDVAQLPYLDMVASEVLRKFPGQLRLERVCAKDYHDPESGLVVKKDTVVVIPVHAIHHDKNTIKIQTNLIQNISALRTREKGILLLTCLLELVCPRNCIGKRIALIESQAIIAHLVHNFRIEPTEKTPSPLQARFIGNLPFPPKDLELKLTPLK
ncbi:Cytochrome P450 3A9 [Orchesella cincta]|uniref:Cytochrome P450 3A9 n=1 Tax=Orchesella cincta TaxID=48709 RepID=A0A1D2MMU2_ORCCI|nr:Cytochrome P450 3A9 [Orchesella cincta]